MGVNLSRYITIVYHSYRVLYSNFLGFITMVNVSKATMI